MTNDNINLRNKVLNMLLEIDDKKQSHIVLKETLDSHKHLEKNQRAFVTRLFRGTIERQIELDYIIDAFSKTPTGFFQEQLWKAQSNRLLSYYVWKRSLVYMF